MFKKLICKYNSTTVLNRFILKGMVLFFIWRVFHKWMLIKGQYGVITEIGSLLYLKTARFLLRIFGFETSVSFAERKLWLPGANDAIEVIYDCLAINLFFVFMIFIIAYPGKLKTKLWYIPLGIVVIFILNSMRMAALTLIVAKNPHLMDLFHHFIFQGIIYLFIFLMWWYFTKISIVNKTKSA